MTKPYERTHNGKYKYKLITHSIAFKCGEEIGDFTALSLYTPNVRLSGKGQLLTITGEYAWDGATYAPDFDKVIMPSLVHDALCQLIRNGLRLDRKVADRVFLRKMRETKFPLAGVYYSAVKTYSVFSKGKQTMPRELAIYYGEQQLKFGAKKK